jgi:glycosyltransferase involved in cell wall biosynthesis
VISVLHVIAPGPLAGAERVVLAGASALREHADVTVAVFVESRAPEHGRRFLHEAAHRDLRAMALGCTGRIDPALVGSLARTLRQGRWDVVHVHGYKALTYALLAGAPASCVLVATHHGDTAATGAVRAYERGALALYRGTARVFAVCEAAANDLVRSGVARSRLQVVLNPAEFGAPARAAPEGATRLLFAGRLVTEKGLDDLLSALSTPGLEAIELHICGDGPARQDLERQAADQGGAVRFFGWVDDVAARLAQVHALVLPSHREGLPMIVLEALAAGRPVLATTVGGIAEVVVHGRTGLLCPPGDAAALAELLRRYLDDRPGFAERAEADAGAFRLRLGPQRWAAETASAYRVLIDARRNGTAHRVLRRLRLRSP